MRINAHTPKSIIHEAVTLPNAIDQIFRERVSTAELASPKEAKFTNTKIKKMTNKVRRVPPLKVSCAEEQNHDLKDVMSERFQLDMPSIFGLGNEDQSSINRPSISVRRGQYSEIYVEPTFEENFKAFK